MPNKVIIQCRHPKRYSMVMKNGIATKTETSNRVEADKPSKAPSAKVVFHETFCDSTKNHKSKKSATTATETTADGGVVIKNILFKIKIIATASHQILLGRNR